MKLKFFFSASTLLSLVLFLSSCGGSDNGKDPETDPCALTTCYNGGQCVNGDCDCPQWYTGSNCSQEVRTLFMGNYYGTLSTETWAGLITGPATIDFKSSSAGVQFLSVDQGYVKFQLTSTTGNFTVPVQQTSDGTYVSAGYGNFSGNQVYFTFGGTDSGGNTIIFTFSGNK